MKQKRKPEERQKPWTSRAAAKIGFTTDAGETELAARPGRSGPSETGSTAGRI
jgi:hypothetical protein